MDYLIYGLPIIIYEYQLQTAIQYIDINSRLPNMIVDSRPQAMNMYCGSLHVSMDSGLPYINVDSALPYNMDFALPLIIMDSRSSYINTIIGTLDWL